MRARAGEDGRWSLRTAVGLFSPHEARKLLKGSWRLVRFDHVVFSVRCVRYSEEGAGVGQECSSRRAQAVSLWARSKRLLAPWSVDFKTRQ